LQSLHRRSEWGWWGSKIGLWYSWRK
jgi:hypothetical protein